MSTDIKKVKTPEKNPLDGASINRNGSRKASLFASIGATGAMVLSGGTPALAQNDTSTAKSTSGTTISTQLPKSADPGAEYVRDGGRAKPLADKPAPWRSNLPPKVTEAQSLAGVNYVSPGNARGPHSNQGFTQRPFDGTVETRIKGTPAQQIKFLSTVNQELRKRALDNENDLKGRAEMEVYYKELIAYLRGQLDESRAAGNMGDMQTWQQGLMDCCKAQAETLQIIDQKVDKLLGGQDDMSGKMDRYHQEVMAAIGEVKADTGQIAKDMRGIRGDIGFIKIVSTLGAVASVWDLVNGDGHCVFPIAEPKGDGFRPEDELPKTW